MDSPVMAEDVGEDDADTEVSHQSYTRRTEHEIQLSQVLRMQREQLLAALAVKHHSNDGYIASEVLVTLVRGSYGTTCSVRDAIALTLHERLIKLFKNFLQCNPEWYSIVSRSSETETEAIAYTRERIFTNRAEVSFAEVTFFEFVRLRLLDWFKSQTRLKNSVQSVDAIERPDDEDGNAISLVDQVEDEFGLSPENALERKQLIERCRGAIYRLPEKQRTALTLCELQDLTHKEAADVMHLSESSVQKYVKAALKGLRNGDWHE